MAPFRWVSWDHLHQSHQVQIDLNEKSFPKQKTIQSFKEQSAPKVSNAPVAEEVSEITNTVFPLL